MTIKELYDWAVENNVTDFDVQIQYRDGGGYCSGSESLNNTNEIIINRELLEVTL